MKMFIRKVSLFLVCSIFLLSFNITAYASDININVGDTRITLDDIIDELTVEDLANVYLEIKNEKDYNQLTLDQKNEYVTEKIIQNYLDPNKIVPMGLSKYLPKGYNELNDEEKRLVRRYPAEAVTYYHASKEAFIETEEVFGGNYTDDASDAFRHTYWNASLVFYFYIEQIDGNGSRPSVKYAVNAAERWTTAHESESYGLPRKMDLSNNELGRNIGARYTNRRLGDISDAVYRAVRDGEAVMIENNRLVPTRI